MSTITIQVTQEDIDEGMRSRSDDCAIVKALKRQLHTYDVSVSALSVIIHGQTYKSSQGIADFVHNFDRDKRLVFPQELLLDTTETVTYPVFTMAKFELACA